MFFLFWQCAKQNFWEMMVSASFVLIISLEVQINWKKTPKNNRIHSHISFDGKYKCTYQIEGQLGTLVDFFSSWHLTTFIYLYC